MHLKPLALADNTAFHNTLILMRPKSTSFDIPIAHDIKVHLHNKFVSYMKDLKEEIKVKLHLYWMTLRLNT